MAKARKQQNDEQKVESSGAFVRHQKICLSIAMENKRLYGTLITKKWEGVTSMATAADAASMNYISSLDKEMAPNLLILCKKAVKPIKESENQGSNDDSMQPSLVDKNVKLVHVDIWTENTQTGIHFRDNIVHPDNQIRRAHCWFPCIDNVMRRCCYDLELTVDHKLVPVSNGTLLYQVLRNDDPLCKIYVYKMDVPVTADSMSLAVATFEISPNRQNAMITHILGASMCIFSSQLLFDEKVIDQSGFWMVFLVFLLTSI